MKSLINSMLVTLGIVKPISGAAHHASIPVLFTDVYVDESTGLWNFSYRDEKGKDGAIMICSTQQEAEYKRDRLVEKKGRQASFVHQGTKYTPAAHRQTYSHARTFSNVEAV